MRATEGGGVFSVRLGDITKKADGSTNYQLEPEDVLYVPPNAWARVGFALQAYVPAGGRQLLGENYWLPMRANFMESDFIELKRPRSDMDPASVEERQRANQNWSDILYQGARQKRNY